MRVSADQRLFLSYLLLISVLVVPISLGAESQLRRQLMEGTRRELERELVLARAFLESSTDLPVDTIAEILGSLSGHRVTIVDPSGQVIGESSPTPLPALRNHLLRPEVQGALAGHVSWSIRRSETLGEDLLYMAVPSSRAGVLRFAVPLADINQSLKAVQRGIFSVAAIALVVAALFSFAFSIAMTRPLLQLRTVARTMADGDLTRRFGKRRNDELGELGEALDTLAGELQRRLSQLEDERAETQTLIDSMVEGVIALTPAGEVRRANPAARRMFTLPADPRGIQPEAVARRPQFLSLVARALAGESVPPIELTSDGNALLATGHPLPDGGAVLVFLDVSELRRLEGVRRDFVANASHELKTPLTAIRGYTETLLEDDLPGELRQKFVEIVWSNARRLQRIVDDLLDLSRIESGVWQISPTPILISTAAAEAWAAQAERAPEQTVRFTEDIDADAARAIADPAALHQIFTNLFSNAVRYTPASGTVTIRARRRTDDAAGEVVQIEVIDTGSGIPAAHLPRIFERFYRVDPARSREDGGTGLGLAIVRHLVEAHGGRIEAESVVGQGTTIRFTLQSTEAGVAVTEP
jgi:two-component system, OmpR family, phosphate regulon sensor histidine kinase PhoR